MDRKFTREDLLFTTLGDATVDQFGKLVCHVANLNEREDQEEPISYLAWMLQHGLGYTYEQGELLARILFGFQTGSSPIPHPDFAAGILTSWRPPKRPANYLSPHQIYLAFERQSGDIVDIAGFVPDDRDVGKIQGLAEKDPRWIGFFGGHNVRRDLRGLGIGPLMITHRVEQIQMFVDKTWRREATVYTFLSNEISGKSLVERGGFEYIGVWDIKFFGKSEYVFRRLFTPQQ